MGSIFKKDIVLDEEAFQTAGNEFKTLSADMESLKAEVDEMLQLIKIGFDTPAGAKFIQSCQTTLIKPLEDQRLVITHISDTLTDAKKQYASVFQEYEQLNQSINKE
ncbi:hypothetical protein DWY36_12885 [Firmicutes bacterium AF25-13AC]|nr:hypothetical protein DWY36_12885 [Firmicutes bacterium AF25-13AC]